MRFLFFTTILVLFLNLLANPVPPKFFSEIIVEEDDSWAIEIYDVSFLYDMMVVDSVRLICSSDTARFNADDYYWSDPFMIYQSSLLSEFDLNTDLDVLSMEFYIDDAWYLADNCSWGEESAGNIGEIPSGQSAAYDIYIDQYGYMDYILSINSEPTPYSDPFVNNTRGNLSCHVYDQNSVPLTNAEVILLPFLDQDNSCYTDYNGYVEFLGFYCLYYELQIWYNSQLYFNHTVPVEPDSTNSITVYIDLSSNDNKILSFDYTLDIYPNPFNPMVNIRYSLGSYNNLEGYYLTIYNLRGYRIINFSITDKEGCIVWDGKDSQGVKQSSGIYICQLRTGEHICSSRKITLIK